MITVITINVPVKKFLGSDKIFIMIFHLLGYDTVKPVYPEGKVKKATEKIEY